MQSVWGVGNMGQTDFEEMGQGKRNRAELLQYHGFRLCCSLPWPAEIKRLRAPASHSQPPSVTYVGYRPRGTTTSTSEPAGKHPSRQEADPGLESGCSSLLYWFQSYPRGQSWNPSQQQRTFSDRMTQTLSMWGLTLPTSHQGVLIGPSLSWHVAIVRPFLSTVHVQLGFWCLLFCLGDTSTGLRQNLLTHMWFC